MNTERMVAEIRREGRHLGVEFSETSVVIISNEIMLANKCVWNFMIIRRMVALWTPDVHDWCGPARMENSDMCNTGND